MFWTTYRDDARLPAIMNKYELSDIADQLTVIAHALRQIAVSMPSESEEK
jgi:hypothetical protein